MTDEEREAIYAKIDLLNHQGRTQERLGRMRRQSVPLPVDEEITERTPSR